MKTESDFLDWLSGLSIFVGYARYGQFGHGIVCASTSNGEDRELKTAVYNLDVSDDNEALEAADIILDMEHCWYGCDPNPVKAMEIMVEKMRRYYFDELHKDVNRR